MSELLIKEHTSSKYTPRTYYNAKSADLTLAIAADLTTAGERCTHKAAGDKYIGFNLRENTSLETARKLYTVIKSNNVKRLNVAGNGIYTLNKYGYSQAYVNSYVYNVLLPISDHLQLDRIFTGGQTGVDIAGAIAGYALGIPTEVTLPKGYIQRFEDKFDQEGSYECILEQIKTGAKQIEKW